MKNGDYDICKDQAKEFKGVRQSCLMWILIKFEHPYLSDLWFGAAPRTDINKMCSNESGLPI